MDAVVGWLVIGLVGFLVYRAFRKWRREWKEGLTTTANAAAEAAATAVARADVGGIHLHIGTSADGRNDYHVGTGDNHVIDVASDDDHDGNSDVAAIRRFMSGLALMPASDRERYLENALGAISSGVVDRVPVRSNLHVPSDGLTS